MRETFLRVTVVIVGDVFALIPSMAFRTPPCNECVSLIRIGSVYKMVVREDLVKVDPQKLGSTYTKPVDFETASLLRRQPFPRGGCRDEGACIGGDLGGEEGVSHNGVRQ